MQAMNPLILTERPQLAVEEFAHFWSFRANTRCGAVGAGAFATEADRPTCVAILRQMWFTKLLNYMETDSRMMAALYSVVETKLFCEDLSAPLSLAAVRPGTKPASWAQCAATQGWASPAQTDTPSGPSSSLPCWGTLGS